MDSIVRKYVKRHGTRREIKPGTIIKARGKAFLITEQPPQATRRNPEDAVWHVVSLTPKGASGLRAKQ